MTGISNRADWCDPTRGKDGKACSDACRVGDRAGGPSRWLWRGGRLWVWFWMAALMVAVSAGGGCGKKRRQQRPPPKRLVQRDTPPPKEEAPPEEEQPAAAPAAPEEAPQEEEEPALPEDVSDWKRDDYFRAKVEGDKRLPEAVRHLGERFVGADAAATAAANMLVNLLQYQEPEPEAPAEPAGQPPVRPGVRPNSPVQVRRPGNVRANTDLIKAVIEALGVNGSAAARKTLEEMVAGTCPTEDDKTAAEAALAALVDHPCPENEAILFRVLTAAEQLRPPGRGEVTADDLCKKAFSLIEPVATERFRLKLAYHLLAPTTPQEDHDLLDTFIQELHPDNVAAQMVLYQSQETDAELKMTIEEYFTDFSSDALTGILAIPSESKTGVGARRPVRRTRPAPRGTQAAAEADPELPYRLARQLWSPHFTAVVEEHVGEIDSLEEEGQLVLLASTMPVDSMRSKLYKMLKKRWEEGPKSLESAGLMGGVFSDPGFLAVVKMLPRKEVPVDKVKPRPGVRPGRPPTRPRPARPGSTQATSAKKVWEQREQAEQDWMTTSEDLFRTLCERFLAASEARIEAARKAGQPPVIGQAAQSLSIELPPSARVVADYSVDWPAGLEEKLSGVPQDPMKICYARVESKAKLAALQGFYRRQMNSPVVHELADGIWLESFRTLPHTDRKHSLDLLITLADDTDPSSAEELDLVVEILSVEVKDPAGISAGPPAAAGN